jgi:hypothetical protein
MNLLIACVTFICHLVFPRPAAFAVPLTISVPWKNAGWFLAIGLVQILHDIGLVCNAIGHIRHYSNHALHEHIYASLE